MPLSKNVLFPIGLSFFAFWMQSWYFKALLIAFSTIWIGIVFWMRFGFPSVSYGTVGFFHPHSEEGGGGERVLWCAIEAIQSIHPDLKILLFTSEGHSVSELTSRAQRNFNIIVQPNLEVISLSNVHFLEPSRYPYFTLLGQAFGSIWVFIEGLQKKVPEILIETTGWAFPYPLIWCLGSRVACYVHYPTISSDMLSRVRSRNQLYNNRPGISNSRMLSTAKILYYRLLAWVYFWVGSFASIVMVNSTWTGNHIRTIWKREDLFLVYPPVDTETLRNLPLGRSETEPFLISVGQFRPEKNHMLQLLAFAKARELASENHRKNRVLEARFKIVGSCRNAADRDRLQKLKQRARDLEIENFVDFYENIPFEELYRLLSGARAGLHTMLDEHFGIGIVEYMAAGAIPIAHNSGGPKMDILASNSKAEDPPCLAGYLRTTVDEYADAILEVLCLENEEWIKVAERSRKRSERFDQERFKRSLLQAIHFTLPKTETSHHNVQ